MIEGLTALKIVLVLILLAGPVAATEFYIGMKIARRLRI